MTIYHNTIFNDLGQTDDITLDAPSSGRDVANKIVADNLLAGGGYSIYGGGSRNNPTSNIVIKDNKFGQLYYSRKAASTVPVAYFDPTAGGQRLVGERLVGDQPARQGPARAPPAGCRAARRPPVRRAAGQRRVGPASVAPSQCHQRFPDRRHLARHRGRDRHL